MLGQVKTEADAFGRWLVDIQIMHHGILGVPVTVVQLAQKLGYCLRKALAVRRAEMSHPRAHSIMLKTSLNALMAVVLWTSLTI